MDHVEKWEREEKSCILQNLDGMIVILCIVEQIIVD